MKAPKRQNDDIAYDAIKSALGLASGGTASELFSYFITPPLEKRREAWMEWVVEKLTQLEKQGKISIAKLIKDDEFIDVLLYATEIAIKTSKRQKTHAIKNAVVNEAKAVNSGGVRTCIFLNLIENFSEWHLRILLLFCNPKEICVMENKSVPDLTETDMSTLCKHVFPYFRGKDELLQIIWSDLRNAKMHNTSLLLAKLEGEGLITSSGPTSLAIEFSNYITTID